MKNDLSIIITLFKTPIEQLKSLNQYKNFPILIFDQATKNNSELISKVTNVKFEYFHSEKNLGLCKSTNFLISKVRTKYFLFTQADINDKLREIIELGKDYKKNQTEVKLITVPPQHDDEADRKK